MTPYIRSRFSKVVQTVFPSLFPVWVNASNGIPLQGQLRTFTTAAVAGPVAGLLVNVNTSSGGTSPSTHLIASSGMAQCGVGGRVWVTGAQNNNIALLDPSTGLLTQQIDVPLASPDSLSSPNALAFLSGSAGLFGAADLMLCGVFNGVDNHWEVAYFTADGTFIDNIFPLTGSGADRNILGMCVDSNNHIWLAYYFTNTFANPGSKLIVIDLGGNEVFAPIPSGNGTHRSCVCFDVSHHVVWAGYVNTISSAPNTHCGAIYDLAGAQVDTITPEISNVSLVDLTIVGTEIWATCVDNFVRRFDLATHAYISKFTPDPSLAHPPLGITVVT